VALLSLLGAGGYATFVLVTGLPTVLLLGLFVPLSIGIEWRLQARRSFRVTLALQGRYDFRGDESGGGHGTVGDPGALRQSVDSLVGVGLVSRPGERGPDEQPDGGQHHQSDHGRRDGGDVGAADGSHGGTGSDSGEQHQSEVQPEAEGVVHVSGYGGTERKRCPASGAQFVSGWERPSVPSVGGSTPSAATTDSVSFGVSTCQRSTPLS